MGMFTTPQGNRKIPCGVVFFYHFEFGEQMDNNFAVQHAVRPGEIVIEIDNEHLHVVEEMQADPHDPFNPSKIKQVKKTTLAGNRNQLFQPYDSRKNGTNTVRSRRVLKRDGTRMRFSMDPAIADIDYIPGERIHIDIQNRIGRITDGCFDPDNDTLLQQLAQASQKMERSMTFTLMPSEYVEVYLKSDNDLWNWIYHMRMICNGDRDHNAGPPEHPGCATEGPRLCRPVQNVDKLPTFEECAKSLKVVLPMAFNGSAADIKAFTDEFKENDPDFSGRLNTQAGTIVLTPYLAGLAKEEELVGA